MPGSKPCPIFWDLTLGVTAASSHERQRRRAKYLSVHLPTDVPGLLSGTVVQEGTGGRQQVLPCTMSTVRRGDAITQLCHSASGCVH